MSKPYDFTKVVYCPVTTPAIRSLLLARAVRAGCKTETPDEHVSANRSLRDPNRTLAYYHPEQPERYFGFTDTKSLVREHGVCITVQDMLDRLTIGRDIQLSGKCEKTEVGALRVGVCGYVKPNSRAAVSVSLENRYSDAQYQLSLFSDNSSLITKNGVCIGVVIPPGALEKIAAAVLNNKISMEKSIVGQQHV